MEHEVEEMLQSPYVLCQFESVEQRGVVVFALLTGWRRIFGPLATWAGWALGVKFLTTTKTEIEEARIEYERRH